MLKIRIYLDINIFWLYNCVKDKNYKLERILLYARENFKSIYSGA